MNLRHILHRLTHHHQRVSKDGMTVVTCRPRLRKYVYVSVQRWPGALWEWVSAEELPALLGVDPHAGCETDENGQHLSWCIAPDQS